MGKNVYIPSIGEIRLEDGFRFLQSTEDGTFRTGMHGVEHIVSTGDGKVEFVHIEDKTMAYVKSSMGYPAYYPVPKAEFHRPCKAVLMDLDGTSVHSEEFWIWIIQMTVASLLENPKFELEQDDIPFVSGHSVSEHLQYCVNKYCPHRTVEQARVFYFEHTNREMSEIMQGRGRKGAFTPAPGLKEFLYTLKERGIKIGLVTSGLYEKAWPEILSAFQTLNMGDPKHFYDAIISAGFALRPGEAGTLGELSPKPHPWLYAETARVGLGIDFQDRHHVVGIEDSGAGICSIRLAGLTAIGLNGGNIEKSGTKGLCNYFCNNLEEVLKVIL